jgi:hypothetical protein
MLTVNSWQGKEAINALLEPWCLSLQYEVLIMDHDKGSLHGHGSRYGKIHARPH